MGSSVRKGVRRTVNSGIPLLHGGFEVDLGSCGGLGVSARPSASPLCPLLHRHRRNPRPALRPPDPRPIKDILQNTKHLATVAASDVVLSGRLHLGQPKWAGVLLFTQTLRTRINRINYNKDAQTLGHFEASRVS